MSGYPWGIDFLVMPLSYCSQKYFKFIFCRHSGTHPPHSPPHTLHSTHSPPGVLYFEAASVGVVSGRSVPCKFSRACMPRLTLPLTLISLLFEPFCHWSLSLSLSAARSLGRRLLFFWLCRCRLPEYNCSSPNSLLSTWPRDIELDLLDSSSFNEQGCCQTKTTFGHSQGDSQRPTRGEKEGASLLSQSPQSSPSACQFVTVFYV